MYVFKLFDSRMFKDAIPVYFKSEVFTSYILFIFKQWNQLP